MPCRSRGGRTFGSESALSRRIARGLPGPDNVFAEVFALLVGVADATFRSWCPLAAGLPVGEGADGPSEVGVFFEALLAGGAAFWLFFDLKKKAILVEKVEFRSDQGRRRRHPRSTGKRLRRGEKKKVHVYTAKKSRDP